MIRLCALSLIVAAHPAWAQDVPRFAETAAGVDHSFTGEWEFMVGGGVASFDCNGDALPDLALSGGTSLAALYVNQSAVGGDLRFERQDSGIEMDMVSGTYPIDIDSDGILLEEIHVLYVAMTRATHILILPPDVRATIQHVSCRMNPTSKKRARDDDYDDEDNQLECDNATEPQTPEPEFTK